MRNDSKDELFRISVKILQMSLKYGRISINDARRQMNELRTAIAGATDAK